LKTGIYTVLISNIFPFIYPFFYGLFPETEK